MQCAALILFNEAFSVSLWRLRDADMTSFPSLPAFCLSSLYAFERPQPATMLMPNPHWHIFLNTLFLVLQPLLH